MEVFTKEFSEAYMRLKDVVNSMPPVKAQTMSEGLKVRKEILERLAWEAFKDTNYHHIEIDGDGDNAGISICFRGDNLVSFWIPFKGGKSDE